MTLNHLSVRLGSSQPTSKRGQCSRKSANVTRTYIQGKFRKPT